MVSDPGERVPHFQDEEAERAVDKVSYQVTCNDERVESITGADARLQEGPLTTFFRTSPRRGVVDSCSTRLASFRTADIRLIRAVDVPQAA